MHFINHLISIPYFDQGVNRNMIVIRVSSLSLGMKDYRGAGTAQTCTYLIHFSRVCSFTKGETLHPVCIQ